MTYWILFQTESDLEMANFTKTMAMEANKYDWKSTTAGLSDTEKRQFKKITEIGFSAVNDTAKIETVSLNLYNVFVLLFFKLIFVGLIWFGLLCLTPILPIFQLYRGGQF